jgi:hypothetical protein
MHRKVSGLDSGMGALLNQDREDITMGTVEVLVILIATSISFNLLAIAV